MTKMKDFVYLDTDEVSSISAQLFEGKILELITEKSQQTGNNTTDQYGSEETTETKANIGITGTNIGGQQANNSFENKSIEFLNNETFKSGVKKAYDDFLYNKILDELEQVGLIKDDDNSSLYDFIELKGDFEFYDSKTISSFFGSDILQRITFMNEENLKLPTTEEIKTRYGEAKKIHNNQKQLNASKYFNDKEEVEFYVKNYNNIHIFKLLQELTTHLNQYLKDKIILINDKRIIIGARENLRIYPETLTLVSDLKLEGLGKVLKKDISSINAINMNPSTLQDKILKVGISNMLMILLVPLLGLKENCKYELIHPVGLEFSKMP
ncbi:hypothetical protein QI283_03330 [Staphylococcus saprophyticus]|uniref:DUF6414 family protein n=1 Tax=Staphylococcus TaxID=1279 RepID=UPI001E44FC75|nr:hypothetical protein [Staphylococcus xylosus]MDW3939151.1 hypothetical protein [Staphylococcus saprophyticus]MCD8851672.1 hypothetical protein [Staphylococcus xylosus]MDW4212582.1 hypothetical protein [Staphylococcus saprophyticus]MDW4227532.1 hypothetical protein [Staphylococcus saprophyticus]MDW4281699.1 hypothetical protein [Staphylococcus saprophyticus]